jgi:hypothetical protein
MHAILTMQTNISIFSGNKEYSQERRIKMCKLSLQTEQARNTLHNHTEQQLYLKKSVQSNQNALHG